jgi:hypothetical protein
MRRKIDAALKAKTLEAVEKLVEVVRHHYQLIYFVIPVAAMSAGTIFCMSGDKIYMDYSSSLGPIDPQVPDREGKFLVPALGHLDKVNEIIGKSRDNTITPVEFQWLMNQDLAIAFRCCYGRTEQRARCRHAGAGRHRLLI